jgi:hypothetical protein
MFQSVDELVDENDRRRALEIDQDEEEEACNADPTPEYVKFKMLPANNTSLTAFQSAAHIPRFPSAYTTCSRHRGQVD